MENLRWNPETNQFDQIDAYGFEMVEIGGEGVVIHPKRRQFIINVIIAVAALAVGMILGVLIGHSDCL